MYAELLRAHPAWDKDQAAGQSRALDSVLGITRGDVADGAGGAHI